MSSKVKPMKEFGIYMLLLFLIVATLTAAVLLIEHFA